MARLSSIDDSKWSEVKLINGYAVFIGYLMICLRGLGMLIITWTSVVLLGGFVSVLGKKDFWCLTGITLVQVTGVFNFLLTEKLGDFRWLMFGSLGAVGATFAVPFRTLDNPSFSRLVMLAFCLVLALFLGALQLLVLAVILCPLAVLYGFGLCISAGVSLWRLIEHDFGNADGNANLKPALQVLYGLAVAQGVLFGYKTIYAFAGKIGVAELAALNCLVDTELVSAYLDATVAGCEKDPSFASGRNLITYAVDLMESRINDSYLIGVRILGTILQNKHSVEFGKSVLIKQLLTGSASFGHAVQRLLDTLGTRSPYSTEIREHAARIVAHVAGSIRLAEQFPGGTMIQCVSSLLHTTFEEYCWRPEGYERDSHIPEEYERDWLLEEHEFLHLTCSRKSHHKSPDSDSNTLLCGYKGQVVAGIRILQALATDEDNCRVISSTQGLLSKITMAPLTSQQLHADHHDEWSSIAKESMELMSRLMVAPGDTGSKLRTEISGSGRAATIANNILECSKCGVFLKRQSIEILLYLSVDTLPSITSSGSNNTIFMGSLLHIFLLPDYCFNPRFLIATTRYHQYWRKMRGSTHFAKKSGYISRLAGEKLQSTVLSLQDQASANESMSLQSSVVAAIANLARTSVDYSANNFTYRLHAVQILEDLCRFYTKDDEYRKELKNAMADVMPKVLKEILCFVSTSAEAEASSSDQVSARRTDIEKGVVPQGDGQEDASSSQQQNGDQQQEGIKLQEALISMCKAIPYKWADEFDDLAEKMCLEQGIPKKDFDSLLLVCGRSSGRAEGSRNNGNQRASRAHYSLSGVDLKGPLLIHPDVVSMAYILTHALVVTECSMHEDA